MSDLVIDGPPFWSPVPEISLGKQIYDSLVKCGDTEVAYVDASTGNKLLYKDFFRLTCDLANCLKNCGYTVSDVIGICSENVNNFFIPVVSALYLGMVLAPINYTYSGRELLHAANITKPKIFFCSQGVLSHIHKLKNIVNYIERIIILDSYNSIGECDSLTSFISKHRSPNFTPEKLELMEVDPFNHLAVVLSSSGTTGLPKGVMTTHDNISVRLNHARDPRINQTKVDVSLGILPFFHGFGFMTNIGSIIQKYTVVVLKGFDGETFLHSIEKYKINTLNLVPPLMLFLAKHQSLSKYDLSSLKEIICGAAPLSTEVETTIKHRFPNIKVIRQGYGLTESTLAVLLIPISEYKPGSCGKVVPGMQCVVRDPENGKRLGPHSAGELCFKGRLITKGYYGNDEATKSTFSSDGWLFTGDIGYYDQDHYFYIVDRLKELIKFKGFQVAPAELEAILLQHPDIKDAGVVGKPDEEAGELPAAFIVKSVYSNITEQQVKAYVNDQVSHTKRLRGGVYFVDEIPRNASGKILRLQLRNILKKKASKL